MVPTQNEIFIDVKRALEEDIGSGDITAQLLAEDLMISAKIISREPMLLCGAAWVNESFFQVDPELNIQWHVDEGQWLDAPLTLCTIKGLARSVLTAERTALNFLQLLSGTATQTYRFLQKIQNWPVKLLDTRKTIPGFRLAQKYAVACAGGSNHRFGLYDAFLIKENHIKACGSIKAAIEKARQLRSDCLIEIEVENIQELQEALAAKPDRILLDNFSSAMLRDAVSINMPKRCELEASGGVTLDTIAEIAQSGVDYISVGTITKSVQAIDLSLLIE